MFLLLDRHSGRRLCRPSTSRGFSLIELGIVIAVIAVLAGGVILSKGFFVAAKKKSTVDLVNALRSAGRTFAVRKHNGVAFGLSESTGDNANAQIDSLMGEGYLSTELKTPWEGLPRTAIIVSPDSGTFCSQFGGSRCNETCAGQACLRIEVEVRDGICDKDFENSFKSQAVAARCSALGAEVSRLQLSVR